MHIIIVLLISSALFIGCPHGSPPVGHVKFWQMDSKTASIVRAQDNERIYCVDPKADAYTCADTQELADRFRELYDACQSWATREELKEYFKNCRCD